MENTSSFAYFFPAVLYCKFRNEKDNKICQNVATTFTESGLGYCTMPKVFFSTVQRKWKESMDIFCQEDVEQTGERTFTLRK